MKITTYKTDVKSIEDLKQDIIFHMDVEVEQLVPSYTRLGREQAVSGFFVNITKDSIFSFDFDHTTHWLNGLVIVTRNMVVRMSDEHAKLVKAYFDEFINSFDKDIWRWPRLHG